MQDGMQTPSISNDGFVTIPDVSIDAVASRTLPREVTSGVTRGTQTIMNTDGSYVTLGLIPNGGTDFGIAFFDAKGNIISKSTGVTDYKYDKITGRNYYQNGLLPDGSYGEVITKAPYNVADAVIAS